MVESQPSDLSVSASSEANSHARTKGKRTKLATSHKLGASQEIQLIGGEHKFQKKPAFIKERNAMFDSLYAA